MPLLNVKDVVNRVIEVMNSDMRVYEAIRNG